MRIREVGSERLHESTVLLLLLLCVFVCLQSQTAGVGGVSLPHRPRWTFLIWSFPIIQSWQFDNCTYLLLPLLHSQRHDQHSRQIQSGISRNTVAVSYTQTHWLYILYAPSLSNMRTSDITGSRVWETHYVNVALRVETLEETGFQQAIRENTSQQLL